MLQLMRDVFEAYGPIRFKRNSPGTYSALSMSSLVPKNLWEDKKHTNKIRQHYTAPCLNKGNL